MSGMEFILFLFIFALISFASILRKRLSGAQKHWQQSREREAPDDGAEFEEAVQASAWHTGTSQPASAGDIRSALARKLAELVDGHRQRTDEPEPTPASVSPPEPTEVRARPTPVAARVQAEAVPSPNFRKLAGADQEPEAASKISSLDIRHVLRNSESIRQAMILKEVLDRPVALRGSRLPGR